MAGGVGDEFEGLSLSDNRAMTPAVRITRLKDRARDDLRYWLSRSVAERIAAVEQLRRDHWGESADTDAEPRLQRVCRLVQRARG